MSILGLVGAGAGMLGGIFGGRKAAKAADMQQQLINQQQARNDAWYNRNYYQNYLDSSESRAAIKRVEETMKRRNQQAQATAAVTGATPEAVMAQQENDQKLMSDTISNLAANADARKAQIDAANLQNQNNILGLNMQQQQMREAGASQMMNNGFGLVGDALSMVDFGKKKTPKPGPIYNIV